MTDVLYFGSDATTPLTEPYITSNPYIQKVLFVNKKKLDERGLETEDMTNLQVVSDVLKTERDEVLSREKFYSVSCGPKYAVLINTEGHLWGFGHGIRTQFGENVGTSGKIPVKFGIPSQLKFVDVGCGDRHVIGMTKNHRIYGWGEFGQGRLVADGESNMKDAANIDLSLFTKVMETDAKSHYKKTYYSAEGPHVTVGKDFTNLNSFTCGAENSYFVVNSKLFVAGRGNLGVGATNIISSEYLQETSYTPYLLYSLFRYKMKGVAAGRSHALAWDTEGFIYSWGNPEFGKLGHPVDHETLFEKEILPKRITSLEHEKIVQASCGYEHSVALTNSGNIYAWGKCAIAQQEFGMREDHLSFANVRPKKLEPVKPRSDVKTVVFVKVTAGAYHNAALDKDGNVYTWGDSSVGCLGHEKTNDRELPTPIATLNQKKAIDVACGEKFTVVIVTNKETNIKPKCLMEFTMNSIQTFKEKLNVIKHLNSKKKKIRFERKKKELTRADDNHIVIPINKISEKNMSAQIAEFYVKKSSTIEKEKLSLTSVEEKTPTLKRLGSTAAPADDDEEEEKNIPMRRGITSSFPHKPKEQTLAEPPKSSFKNPRKSMNNNLKSAAASAKKISYVFDVVTEQLNQKSEYYYEFNVLQHQNKRPTEDFLPPASTKFNEKLAQPKTLKQVETDLIRKNHMRENNYLDKERMLARSPHSRPQTAKNSTTLESLKKSNLQLKTNEDFLSMRLSRPTSSYSVRQSVPKTFGTFPEKEKEEAAYDSIKHAEMIRRHEEAEYRNSALIERKTKEIKKMADDRNWKIACVQEKKGQIQAQRKFRIADSYYKKSIEFKQLAEHVKGRKQYIDNFQREMIALLGVQLLSEMMKNTIEVYSGVKQVAVQRNLKASKIQKAWKKHRAVMRMKNLQPRQLYMIRLMVLKYLTRRKRILRAKRIRKVQLMIFYQSIAKKVNQKLIALRNMIIPLQKFIQWSRKVSRVRFRKLILAWDTNVHKLISSKTDDALVKISTRFEGNLNRQRRVIDNESNALGLNKKDENKKAGDIKTRFEVILDHMKLRGAMLSLTETDDLVKQQQQQQQPPQSVTNLGATSKTNFEGRSAILKYDGLPSFEQICRETILPFSAHDEDMAFSALYSIKKDSSMYERILPKLIECENKIKTKILTEIYQDRVRAYRASLRQYERQLKDFIIKNKREIDLERTKMMLRTPKETLRAISKKEEAEYQMEQSNQGNGNRRRNLTQLFLAEKDHLPFAKLKVKIASNMPDAPKLPTFKVGITFEEFKPEWKRYQEEYKNHYTRILQVSRTKGILMKHSPTKV